MKQFIEEITTQINRIDSAKLTKLKELVLNAKGNIIILGNGGSNAIASHIAEDYTKMLQKPTLSFSDSVRLTCYANDYGYENAFSQYLKEFSQEDGLVILISSSGNSANIKNCVKFCVENKRKFIILTGFSCNNSLRTFMDKAELEFWVDSTNYGIVECVHEIILHSII